MPVFTAEQLQRLGERLLQAAGTPVDIAAQVARSLVDSNLKGVDSHGVIRLPAYLGAIDAGDIKPDARPTLDADDGAMAVARGHGGYGIFAMEFATAEAVRRAKAHHLAAVGVIDVAHTGRIGQFAEQAVAHDLFVMILGGGAWRGLSLVAPFGGAEPIMATNPYAFAMPGGDHGPVVADFATSAASRGKILHYHAQGKALPPGWIADTDGNPSTDPQDFLDGGPQLPAAGHKGYGMGLIAELIGDAMLTRTGDADMRWLIITLDIASFRAPADYARNAAAYLDRVKAVAPAPGFARVMLPGELERHCAATRRAEGIAVPETTWDAMREAGDAVGVDAAAVVAA